MDYRFLGIDVGAETVKVVELTTTEGRLRWTRRAMVEHHKEPTKALFGILSDFDWTSLSGAAVSGRASRQVALERVPTKQAQAKAFRFLVDDGPGTVVSIGSHGFSVLELRDTGLEVFRENSRCSQGTGNFLRQLVERFNMGIDEASVICANVEDPAPLSGRCPVILKTDMTHLANKGESQPRILAGLYDAVCENVQVLIKPRITPPRVLLAGGVTRAERIRTQFGRFCKRHEMTLLPSKSDDGLYLEALGAALVAEQQRADLPALADLLKAPKEAELDFVDAPSKYLSRITHMPKVELPDPTLGPERQVVLGFDIGSTGSKAVAIDVTNNETIWDGYINTNGNPVSAAQTLVKQYIEGDASRHHVLALGATGSGREIVSSLLSTCYGSEPVYVINEIAAHAEGALHYDSRVDTIFEIGGQDAKYIRLADGRVVDAAMNEACSAGTGSFIEEQGRKFAGIDNVVQLGQEALGAENCVSLGQHCSVFMAEIIDEAVAAGVHNRSIIAGIYDSIIQNYLNRVKGSRSVGDVIFCQGMPFSADALAAAVARQTGSEVVIPPNPGTVGALGIALLTRKNVNAEAFNALDLQRFLEAKVLRKDTFVCTSTKGCGGAGNFCRIDRIDTRVAGKKQRFTWGGGCSLWDRGTRKQKLPDLAPDPFREREDLVQQLLDRLGANAPKEGKTVALADEFQLKTLLPFFATFIHELGFKIDVHRGADHGALKRGIEEANVPFCAPMQQFHGLVSVMAEKEPDFLFLPMVKDLPRVKEEKHATVCPIVQGSTDMLRWDLGPEHADRVISPVISFGAGGGFESKTFIESCQGVAGSLGVFTVRWWRAYQKAVEAQRSFEIDVLMLGKRALDFCRTENITPVVVLGRAYTIYNKVLNSNVPAILREQGAIAIPVDCYPVNDEVPVYEHMYWGFGQRNLRAVHQLRRTPGVYGLWCSNYSCGPDSFSLHFFAYQMEGKPFAVIETDGHSGDAGTKTRVEAFLHCVREDLQSTDTPRQPNSLLAIEQAKRTLPQIRRNKERLLIPRMGPGAEMLAAAFDGAGIPSEALPMPTRDTLQTGRRYTSGKECVPMALTLGALVDRLEREKDTDNEFCFFMPTANGPCRFGVYNMLHKITLERLGFKDRVRVWSPVDSGYFEGAPAGLAVLIFAGFCAVDVLLHGLYGVRPVERKKGEATEIHDRYFKELLGLIHEAAQGELTVPYALLQVANGRLFGVAELLRRAANEMAAIKTRKKVPAVAVVGEIYVRCDPFANDFIIEKLEERGIRAAFAPFNEWLEYTDHINYQFERANSSLGDHFSSLVQRRVQARTYNLMAERLGWPPRTTVQHSLAAAKPYVRRELTGEAVLTVGGPLHEWREGEIDGVISVGPLECMPNKISEAQFFHVAEREGLASLTLPLNGDPIDPEVLDNFAFEIKARFAAQQERRREIEERETFNVPEPLLATRPRTRPTA
ncbi:MAG: CoA activase [Deltaproteobacteria bacterium]|nr:CoA activase [Deltaproteobacteria bacterium]